SFRIHLACIQRRGAFLESLGELSQFSLGGSLYGIQSLRARFRLGRYLSRYKIAIAHAFDFYTNLTLIPAAKMARVPVVIGSQRQIGDLLTWAQSRVQTAAFRLCDRVVCNSRAAADRLANQGIPQQKLMVIRNGLASAAFAETTPALPHKAGILRVGMIARMNHVSKNHRGFLRAATRVSAKVPNVEFLLVGDGPLRPELERVVENLGLVDRVHFLGNRRDIPAILASLDLSVLPSASESMSNVILESMAAGVPIIANRVGGNPELITERNGILVPPDDDEALSAAIEALLCDKALRVELGQNARQFAQANFTLEQMRNGYERLYADLLEIKGWRRRRT
ncbi:MAG: hypothetical protein DMG97_22430, partial [Acidobacteria bacterium]